ncbi:hypothetical protein C8Q80DRAFT_829525 [Daedaleopsis nitida]|nr:hypothetical protein C8Q80DRAFT_829525 [Daedaleopsis nitida]
MPFPNSPHTPEPHTRLVVPSMCPEPKPSTSLLNISLCMPHAHPCAKVWHNRRACWANCRPRECERVSCRRRPLVPSVAVLVLPCAIKIHGLLFHPCFRTEGVCALTKPHSSVLP